MRKNSEKTDAISVLYFQLSYLPFSIFTLDSFEKNPHALRLVYSNFLHAFD